MTKVNKPIINYTRKDFASIKKDLVNYAQKYYPETYRDFNEASFGSLLLDMVSYVGDTISFYTDYQANESYLDTAFEFNNVLSLSKHLGYKYKPNASSFGYVSFFITVPSLSNTVSPNYSYAPILKKGSTFKDIIGNMYTLVEDVDFSNTTDEVLVGQTNTFGSAPTRFALKAKGMVVSGELFSQTFLVKDYEKFLKLKIMDRNVTEIISVFDAEGNNYYEVDYLSQDVIYLSVLNLNEDKKFAKNILKPMTVPRRFVVEHFPAMTTLQFGYGTNDGEEKVLDPSSVILDVFGKSYISDKSFDPTKLTKTTKLGLAPTNTAITVLFRRNTTSDVNAPPGTLTKAVNPLFQFPSSYDLDAGKMLIARESLELINEETITGTVLEMTPEEIKLRARGVYGSQNRAVTKEDYISLCYNMPANFGTIKKATLLRDDTSFNGKNLNLYTLSSASDGSLVTTNNIIKQNLKTWIDRYKMVGDTIDILDAKIINLQIRFSVIAYANINKFDVVNECIAQLSAFYRSYHYDIGEPFKITDIYKILNSIPTVVDTKMVEVTPINGLNEMNFAPHIDTLLTSDGRYLVPPEDSVFEIKMPEIYISGEVI